MVRYRNFVEYYLSSPPFSAPIWLPASPLSYESEQPGKLKASTFHPRHMKPTNHIFLNGCLSCITRQRNNQRKALSTLFLRPGLTGALASDRQMLISKQLVEIDEVNIMC